MLTKSIKQDTCTHRWVAPEDHLKQNFVFFIYYEVICTISTDYFSCFHMGTCLLDLNGITEEREYSWVIVSFSSSLLPVLKFLEIAFQRTPAESVHFKYVSSMGLLVIMNPALSLYPSQCLPHCIFSVYVK